MYISSNINEVIRAVLNTIIFLRKDFACTKSVKKHKKAQKAQKRSQAKVQNATSEQK